MSAPRAARAVDAHRVAERFEVGIDQAGYLWFGTDKGVSRYDGKTWQRLGKADGLVDANVYALAAAPDGNVWAGTKGGVVRLAPAGAR